MVVVLLIVAFLGSIGGAFLGSILGGWPLGLWMLCGAVAGPFTYSIASEPSTSR